MTKYDTPLCKEHFKELAALADQIESNLKLFIALGFLAGFLFGLGLSHLLVI